MSVGENFYFAYLSANCFWIFFSASAKNSSSSDSVGIFSAVDLRREFAFDNGLAVDSSSSDDSA